MILRAQSVAQFGCRWSYCIPLQSVSKEDYFAGGELLQTHRSPLMNHRLLSDSTGKGLRQIPSMGPPCHVGPILVKYQLFTCPLSFFFFDILFNYEYRKVLLVTFSVLPTYSRGSFSHLKKLKFMQLYHTEYPMTNYVKITSDYTKWSE